MPLILAIEPDRRQASLLTSMVQRRLGAELILVDTTERALDAIGNRVPDLLLVPALLSPQDDAALATALRVIAAASDVQMLTTPVLGAARPRGRSGGGFLGLRRGRSRSKEPEGCDPNVFAEQIASYLERAAGERATLVADARPADPVPIDETPEVPAARTVRGEVAAAAAAANVPAATSRVEARTPVPATVEAAPDLAATLDQAAVIEPPRLDADDGAAIEPPRPDDADERVSIAVVEAVRALFANRAPKSEAPAIARPTVRPTAPLTASPTAPLTASPTAPPSTMSLDQFMADFEEMSLPVVEASEGGDWAPSMIEEPARLDVEAEVVDIDLAAAIEGLPDTSASEAEDAAKADVVVARQAVESARSSAVNEPLGGELRTGNAHAWPGLEGLPAESAAAPVPVVSRPEPAAVAAKGEREWVELIESLRHDVERLRAERAKPSSKASAPRPARANKTAKPIQDEWGFFDPEQCGFAALLAKLDDVTKSDENVRA